MRREDVDCPSQQSTSSRSMLELFGKDVPEAYMIYERIGEGEFRTFC